MANSIGIALPLESPWINITFPSCELISVLVSGFANKHLKLTLANLNNKRDSLKRLK